MIGHHAGRAEGSNRPQIFRGRSLDGTCVGYLRRRFGTELPFSGRANVAQQLSHYYRWCTAQHLKQGMDRYAEILLKKSIDWMPMR